MKCLVYCCIAFVISGPVHAQPQLSQVELAADLVSRDADRVGAALNAIPLDIDPESLRRWKLADGFEASPALTDALINALDHEATQYELAMIGEPYEMLGDESLLALTYPVIALDDPRTIPVLMRVAHTARRVLNALLDFGPSVINEAVRCAHNPGRWTEVSSGCLRLLSEALDRWTLGQQTLDQIEAAALNYLTCNSPAYRNELRSISPAMDIVAKIGTLETRELAAPLKPLLEGNPDAWQKCGWPDLNTDGFLSWKRDKLLPLIAAQ